MKLVPIPEEQWAANGDLQILSCAVRVNLMHMFWMDDYKCKIIQTCLLRDWLALHCISLYTELTWDAGCMSEWEGCPVTFWPGVRSSPRLGHTYYWLKVCDFWDCTWSALRFQRPLAFTGAEFLRSRHIWHLRAEDSFCVYWSIWAYST